MERPSASPAWRPLDSAQGLSRMACLGAPCAWAVHLLFFCLALPLPAVSVSSSFKAQPKCHLLAGTVPSCDIKQPPILSFILHNLLPPDQLIRVRVCPRVCVCRYMWGHALVRWCPLPPGVSPGRQGPGFIPSTRHSDDGWVSGWMGEQRQTHLHGSLMGKMGHSSRQVPMTQARHLSTELFS